METKYPIYIISKGRAKTCLTANSLDAINVPFRVVVEPQEEEEYAETIGRERLLVLPFANLGQGSIPVRNWVWEHSISEFHERHWIMDDNIQGFFRLNRNVRHHSRTGIIFIAAEDFVDRYENVAMSGLNYRFFCCPSNPLPAYYLNTRIYSCILIMNKLPHRWRGRYNEDTDISLRFLKDGWCTILFNAFLCGKIASMTMKGGNTDEIYADGDDRLKFAQSLRDQHPDVVKVTRKYGRWHHHVDYRGFKNQLQKKTGLTHASGIDEYGMVLKSFKEPQV